MKMTPALQKQIEELGADSETIGVATSGEGITFYVGDIAISILYGTGSAKKYVVNGNTWSDENNCYTGSYRVGQADSLTEAVALCKMSYC